LKIDRRTAPLLAATAVSVTGDGAFFAAAPLLAASLTDDAVEVGAVTAAFSGSWLLFGLWAGALVDRWPRRTTMIAADLVRTAILGITGLLVALDSINVVLLILAVLVTGAAQCFFDTASLATVPILVGRREEELRGFNGKYWVLDTLGRGLVGPPIGSAAFSLSRAIPFVGDAISFAFSAMAIRLLPPEANKAAPENSDGIGQSILAALRLVGGESRLRLQFAAMGAYNLSFRMATSTLALFVTVKLDLAPFVLGVLFAVMAAGGVAGSWLTPRMFRRTPAGRVILAALVLQAMAWTLTVVSNHLWLIAPAMALSGVASSVITVPVVATQQSIVSSAMMGRVSSVYRIISASSASVGALAGGVVAALGGLIMPFGFATVMLIGAVVVLMSLGIHRAPLKAAVDPVRDR
jgi:MFS family permease